MKAFGILAVLIAMLIVIYLTVTNLNKTASEKMQNTLGKEAPENITELPGHFEKKLNDAVQKNEDKLNDALKGLE